MADHTVRIVIVGEDKLSPAVKSASKNLGTLGTAATVAGGLLTVHLAKKAVSAGAEFARLGAQSLAARDRLIAFAGGSANAAAMLDALITSSDGTIDRFTATQQAARLLQMGVVDTADEMGALGAIVGKLGDQALSLETRMQTFTMMMANQSKLRLDTFGLSVERVTARQKELEAQGYSTQEAFKVAVFEEAEVALETLGDTADTVATRIARIDAVLANLKTTAGETIAQSRLLGTVLDAIDWETQEAGLRATQEELVRLGVATQEEVEQTYNQIFAIAGLYATNEERAAQMVAMAAQQKEYNVTLEEGRAAIERYTLITGPLLRAYAGIEVGVAAATEAIERMTAAEARAALTAEIAARSRTEQLEDFTRQAEDMERGHQERIQQIIASGQQSASEIARDAYNERLSALNAALQAEASALRAAQQARMAALREAQQARTAALRDAQRAEMAALRAVQQERMAALRAAQQAEMDALREAQQARVDAVRDAMQAELAALAEGIAQRNFQKRLEDMAQQHQDRIKAIRDAAADSAVDIENRRYRGVVDALNAEQKARLDALKAQYGKGDDAGTKREDLEEEHRRRMMGLYTDSAREQERKRYEEALKELEYQEEEAALLEDFQGEKADAEAAHRDELERIRQEDLARQIREEEERYAAAVAAAKEQERIRIEDANARREITERFAAIIEAMERRDREEREAQEAAHNAARAAETGRSDAEREAMEQSHNAQRVALANLLKAQLAAVKQAEIAEREAMEQSHNAQRAALAAQLKAQLDAIRQAEIAQRIAEENASYQRSQQDLQRSRDRADNTWRDSLRRQRIALTEHMLKTDKLTAEWAEREYLHVVYWRTQRLGGPQEYATGTSFHPGGLAIVGEKGPELLDLPVGTSVTPMSKAGAAGGGIVIHNYFGRGSIRSDRDVIDVAEKTEKAFRLRGVRAL